MRTGPLATPVWEIIPSVVAAPVMNHTPKIRLNGRLLQASLQLAAKSAKSGHQIMIDS